jgi:phosphate-selective porin OprO/OprP
VETIAINEPMSAPTKNNSIVHLRVCLMVAAALSSSAPWQARAQQRPLSPDLDDIRCRLELQEQEIRSLRNRLSVFETAIQPLPPENVGVALSAMVSSLSQQADSATGDSQRQNPLDKRVEAIEKSLKKEADEAKKKAADDAKRPSVKLRGRVHTDAAWFDQNDLNRATVGDIEDGVYFRRLRFGADAKAFEVTEYRLDLEMGDAGRPSIFDAYGRVTHLPVLGNIQLGHFREPFSLEAQTSSNWYTFIERGLPNAFDPSRNWGIMTFNHNESQTMTWAVGAFREGSDDFGSDIGDSGERAVTSRITFLPYYDEASEGRYLFHLGSSFSYRSPDEDAVRYRERPEVRLAEQPNPNGPRVGVPFFVDTGTITSQNVELAGVEAAWIYGPLSIQGEYITSFVDPVMGDDLYFHGAYIYASYFLTGESRQYDRALGTYGSPKVYEPFFHVRTDRGICTGSGAWDVAVRWSYLDLNDGVIQGGYLDDTTFGVNWYLHPYMRMMFNYIYADLNDPATGESDAHIFLTRLDVHF